MSLTQPTATAGAPSAPLEQVLTSLDVGVCVWELETPNTPSSLRLVHCNPAAGVFLAVDPSFVVGKRIHEGFPGSENMPLPGIFTRVIESGEQMKLGEVPYSDAHGEGMFSIVAHPLPGRRCAVEFTNVTERKRAEQQVAERTEQLTRALAELYGEMDLARKIQTVLVPARPALRGYEVAAQMRPAQSVGGDYYDVFESGDASWILIGDVSGHGVSAGLIMMMVQTAVRTVVTSLSRDGAAPSPAAVLTAVNAAVHGNLQRIGKDQYMTITALCVQGGRVRYAGLHQDILVHRKAGGRLERLETDGVWLGVVEDASQGLEDRELTLAPGDTVLLFTDGLTEAGGAHAADTQERLQARFAELAGAGVPCAEVVKALMGPSEAEAPHDDVTVLVARRREDAGAR